MPISILIGIKIFSLFNNVGAVRECSSRVFETFCVAETFLFLKLLFYIHWK